MSNSFLSDNGGTLIECFTFSPLEVTCCDGGGNVWRSLIGWDMLFSTESVCKIYASLIRAVQDMLNFVPG